MNPWYADSFGFTEKEVMEALSFYGLEDKFAEVKNWYDGYRFGETDIYNPWSILNYVKVSLANRDAIPRPYWSNTSSNSIVKELVENADSEVRQEIEKLIAGGTIKKPVYEDITYDSIYDSQDNLWNFLYFTGYLKAGGGSLEDDTNYMKLMITNTEIRTIYKRTILCIQNPELGLGDDTTKIILNTKGKMDDVNPEMKKLLNFIDGKEPEDDFTRELDEAVKSVRKNEKWRLDYMTLQMNYQEKYEQGVEQEKIDSAMRMIEDGDLSLEKIAMYSGLTLEQVLELEKELQPL